MKNLLCIIVLFRQKATTIAKGNRQYFNLMIKGPLGVFRPREKIEPVLFFSGR